MIFLKSTWVSIGLFLLALVFEVFHVPRDWPVWLGWFSPLFTLLVVLFWVIEYPNQISFFLVWVFGIFLDVLYSSLLGLNGVLLLALSFIAWKFCERFVSYSYFQQSVFVFFICLCYCLIYAFISQDDLVLSIFDSLIRALVSAVVWPYFSMSVRRIY